jgi:protoporphyrinogen oxidase
MNLILGAGLSGLSCSYHLGHDNCVILEAANHAYGHIHSRSENGFTWDEGPHVSFTKHEYVKELFVESVGGEYEEQEVTLTNYWNGHWIEHPAQLHLHALPEDIRKKCVDSFLEIPEESRTPLNYGEWLDLSFGKFFANEFSRRYTRKYWTVEAEEMGTDWVGGRIHRPEKEALLAGSQTSTGIRGHYIQKIRYPSRGGYKQFARKLADGARIHFGAQVVSVDAKSREVQTADGKKYQYNRLVNTLPLPVFLGMLRGIDKHILEIARELKCSRLLLVNIAAKQPTPRPNPWFYVYDEDKISTRINFTERLSPHNAPTGSTGIQTEVYYRKGVTDKMSPEAIAAKVKTELKEMGLLQPDVECQIHTWPVNWANVIFTKQTSSLLEQVWAELEKFGLIRESQDTSPITDWSTSSENKTGSLAMAGRFGQWKYFWTDDCVLRGKSIAHGSRLI